MLVIHLIFVALWVGGVASWLPLVFGDGIENDNQAYATYLNMREIAFNVIGWGGIGSFFTGLLLGVLTPWRLFKHRWVSAKLVLTIALIMTGMFFVEPRVLANIGMVESDGAAVLAHPVFRDNLVMIRSGIALILAGFFIVIAIAVLKPRLKLTSGNP